MERENIVSWVVFAVIVVSFFVDQLLGIRVLGVAEAGYGFWIIWKRELPYGIRGRPPSGYVRGWAAVIAGIVAVLIGAMFIAVPQSIDNVFAHGR